MKSGDLTSPTMKNRAIWDSFPEKIWKFKVFFHEIWKFDIYSREIPGNSLSLPIKSGNLTSTMKNLEIWDSFLGKIWKFEIHSWKKSGNLRFIAGKNLEIQGLFSWNLEIWDLFLWNSWKFSVCSHKIWKFDISYYEKSGNLRFIPGKKWKFEIHSQKKSGNSGSVFMRFGNLRFILVKFLEIQGLFP